MPTRKYPTGSLFNRNILYCKEATNYMRVLLTSNLIETFCIVNLSTKTVAEAIA